MSHNTQIEACWYNPPQTPYRLEGPVFIDDVHIQARIDALVAEKVALTVKVARLEKEKAAALVRVAHLENVVNDNA